jgi:hypothetical protein
MDFIGYVVIIVPVFLQLPFSMYFVRRRKFVKALLINLLFPLIYGLALFIMAYTVKGAEFAMIMWPIYSVVGLVSNYIYILIAKIILTKKKNV